MQTQTVFPTFISLTITNHCNLRCWMCGQWSEEGYMHEMKGSLRREMELADWKRVVDELADHAITSLLLRGGEPFLYPEIIELLDYINSRGIYTYIDTNGTMIEACAADLVRIGDIHLTISIDGQEEIHDQVRGVPGTYKRVKKGVSRLAELEQVGGKPIGRSINFTISQASYQGLGEMPDVARSLGINSISIVPYYYVPEHVGRLYEKEMREHFACPAFSWRGFHHEGSGVDFQVFLEQYRQYQAALDEVVDFPYMALNEEQYQTWFGDPLSPVLSTRCLNVEKLIDVQPQGDVNFCVDFPDYSFGNVKEASLAELWNSDKALRFREYRRKQPLAVCCRCGAKYMAEL